MSDEKPWRPGARNDPWLGQRLAHSAAIRKAEGQVYRAAWHAFRKFATEAEERVLAGTGVQAAGDEVQPDPSQVLALAWLWSELLDTDIVTALAYIMDDRYRAELGARFGEILGALPRIPPDPGTTPPRGRGDAPVDAEGHPVYSWDRDPYVHEHLATVRNYLARVPEETFDRLTRELSAGVAEGESIPELAERVHQELTAGNCETWRGRAVTVARTETISAYNGGTDAAYGALGAEDDVEYHRRWLATIDKRTRETHRAADDQLAAPGHPFTVGGYPAKYPGDPLLPAAERINCRCTALYEKTPGETTLTNRQSLGAAATQEDTMARTLSGLIAPYDKPTGDGRRFAVGSLTNRDLPLPLQWQRKTNDGHYDSVTVGRITALNYGDTGVVVPPGGAELFDPAGMSKELADDIRSAAALIEQGVVGPSVDLDDFEVEFVKAGTTEPVNFEDLFLEEDAEEVDIEMLVTEGRICAATLVSIPAFAEVKLTFDADGTAPAQVDAPAELSLAASGGPVRPPLEWFHRALTEPTPLTVEDDGRVYGHLAAWGTCHVGIGNACVTPPESHNDYASFHTGAVVTADGDRLAVGKLTLGGGHADPRHGYVAAVEHYDDAGACVAVVRAYEDEFGIAVAGALVAGVTDEQVAELRRSPLSGDWRSIGGNLELVAALAVNVPGFPIPTSRVAAGQPVSLVAAGMVPPAKRTAARTARPAPVTPSALADLDTLAKAMALGIKLDRDEQARTARRGELAGAFSKVAAERRVARRAALAAKLGGGQ